MFTFQSSANSGIVHPSAKNGELRMAPEHRFLGYSYFCRGIKISLDTVNQSIKNGTSRSWWQ